MAIPSPWAQAYPRSVRLAPDGLLVPAATLRHLLGRSHPPDLLYTGPWFLPWIRNGGTIRVRPVGAPGPGDLVLCDTDGWADLRRVVARRDDGTLVTALDACPAGRATLPAPAVLGVVSGVPSAGGALGRVIAALFPVWSRVAALMAWCRDIAQAPVFGDDASRSVREKYAQQVAGYTAMLGLPFDPDVMEVMRGRVPRDGALLVIGSGVGGEALQLACEGYRVTGIDFVPEMVGAGRANARAAGIVVEFIEGDVAALDLPGARFDAVYFTPMVYSFIRGRSRRVESLRRVGRHLRPDGMVIFSAALFRNPGERLQALLSWLLRRRTDREVELGDWHTRFLTPQGAIGSSFVRRFAAGEVIREARRAGVRRVERLGRAHFIASRFGDYPVQAEEKLRP